MRQGLKATSRCIQELCHCSKHDKYLLPIDRRPTSISSEVAGRIREPEPIYQGTIYHVMVRFREIPVSRLSCKKFFAVSSGLFREIKPDATALGERPECRLLDPEVEPSQRGGHQNCGQQDGPSRMDDAENLSEQIEHLPYQPVVAMPCHHRMLAGRRSTNNASPQSAGRSNDLWPRFSASPCPACDCPVSGLNQRHAIGVLNADISTWPTASPSSLYGLSKLGEKITKLPINRATSYRAKRWADVASG